MRLRVQVVTSIAVNVALHHHLGHAPCAAQTVIEIGSCEELQQAVQLTVSSGDTTASLAPGGVSCDEWTTFEIENNKLRLVAQEGASLGEHHAYAFENVRFLVSSGVLQAYPAISFTAGADKKSQEVNGGVLNVAQGAYARFESAVFMKGVTIESVPRAGPDVASDKWFGGCIYNQGSVRFADYLQASNCATVAGAGGIPGNGGGVFNGKTGEIVFKGTVNISDCRTMAPAEVVHLVPYQYILREETDAPSVLGDSETDYSLDETRVDGNVGRGGAIYNEGKIGMFKTATFLDNASGAGGAIFNEGEINFAKTKRAMFIGNRSQGSGDCQSGEDGREFSGGQVLNTGSMAFDGGVVFEDGRTEGFGGAIGNYGSVSIKTSALFKRNSAGCMGGSISSPSNATFELLEDARFQSNTVAYDEAMCQNWFQRDAASYTPNMMSFRCLRSLFGV